MKIKYLGTAAYEGVPSLFCECETCRKSKELGGRNLRSRSQALINDELLVDFPADTVWHTHRYGLDWSKICGCIITHSHSDHLYPEDAEMLTPGFARSSKPFRFYSGKNGYDKLSEIANKERVKGMLQVSLVEPMQKFTVGGKYTVTALPADHDPSSTPFIYVIETADKRMLYAHDSGLFPEETWKALCAFGKFDLLSLDCTGGMPLDGDWEHGHMSLGSDLRVVKRLTEANAIHEKTVVVINHFTHNCGQTHDEMVEACKGKGVIVAYDGLEIEF